MIIEKGKVYQITTNSYYYIEKIYEDGSCDYIYFELIISNKCNLYIFSSNGVISDIIKISNETYKSEIYTLDSFFEKFSVSILENTLRKTHKNKIQKILEKYYFKYKIKLYT